MDKKSRHQYVDIIKGFAILMVIVFHAHNGLICSSVSKFFHPWDVPIFFIVAGFFLRTKSMDSPLNFLYKKMKTLYIPATVIYIIAILMHNVCIDLDWYRLGDLHPGNNEPFQYYEPKDIIIRCLKAIFCAGSGELIMGAMWFLYTLIYSFVGLCLLRCLIKKAKNADLIEGAVLLLGAIISCVLTQHFSITISRVNVTITAMLLIYIGMYVNQYLKWQYDNVWFLLICIMLFVQCVILQHVTIVLARNDYQDLFQLCIGSCCAIYILGYIAKKVEKTLIGNLLSLMGRESFYLMALHILGFFVCSSILWKLGWCTPDNRHGMYTYCTEERWDLLLAYVISGILIPLMIIAVFRYIRKKIIFLYEKCKMML